MRYMKYIGFLILYFMSPELFAGVFDVVPTDKSKEYLGIIFGGSVGAVSLGGSANAMLSQMFERFNVIIVTAGVVILSYVGIVSAINTAREGEAMGKKFSLWVPLRGLFGMLLMLPSPGTGYSLVQMTVIWIVLNGIGAANSVWNTVLDQMARGLKVVGNIQVNVDDSALNLCAQKVLASSICMAKLNNLPQLDLTKNYGPVKPNVTFQPMTTASAPTTGSAAGALKNISPISIAQTAIIRIGVAPSASGSVPNADQEICGSINVDTTIINPALDPNTLDAFNQASLQRRLQIKVNAILAMYGALSDTAKTIASCQVNATRPCTAPSLDSGYMKAAADAYKAQIVQLAGGVRSDIAAPSSGISFNYSGPGSPNYNSNANAPGYSSGGSGGIGNAVGGVGNVAGGTVGNAIGSGASTAASAVSGAADSVKQSGEYLYNSGAATVNAAGDTAQAGYDSTVSGAKAIGNSIVQGWEQPPTPVAITSNQTNALKRFGWIHAGSYYYVLSQQTAANSGFNPDSLSVPTVKGTPTPLSDANISNPSAAGAGSGTWSSELFNQLLNTPNRQNFNQALQWGVDAAKDTGFSAGALPALGSGQASTGDGFVDEVMNRFSKSLREPIINYFQSQITEQKDVEDPLVSMGRFGWKLMMAGETMIFTSIAVASIIMLGISAGSCLNPLPWMGQTVFGQVFLIVYGVTAMLWGAGAALGVYMPLVPYIVFTVTAFGWMIAVVEAVVGAPFIALSLVQPSGEELGQIKAALGIIGTIFLKPVLMIFGFILAGSVMKAGLTMLNFGFIKAINQSVLPTIFNVVVTLALLVFIDIMFVNKAFELIHLLPSKVLRFMGLQPESGGEGEMMKEAKGGFDTGSKAAHETLMGASKKAQELGSRQRPAGELPSAPESKSASKDAGANATPGASNATSATPTNKSGGDGGSGGKAGGGGDSKGGGSNQS